MNIKLTALSAGILVAISTTASAVPANPTVPTPPAVPAMYEQGPQYPLLNTTNLSVSEKTAFALFEGVMQLTEAKIHATSCQNANFELAVYADGRLGTTPTEFNSIKVTGANGSQAPQFELRAGVGPDVVGRGQHIYVSLFNNGVNTLGSTKIGNFAADYVYNNVKNMMVTNSATMTVVGINGTPDTYTGNVIKDFYHGSTVSTDREYYNIYDWGLQSVSKLGYPVNKWWQRSKTHRDDGVEGRTVWVKDRLVGSTECRITLDTSGYNNQSIFWQGGAIGAGTLKIEKVLPTAPVNADPNGVEAWTQYPFNI